MAGKVNTVTDLVSAVRSLLDEDNNASVKDVEDILPALNRAQDVAANILARHYESPLLTYKIVTTVSGQREYPIPDDAFEERLEKIEVEVNSLYYPVSRIDYRHLSQYETQGATSIPYYYAIIGGKYRLLPTSNGTYSLRVWYNVDPLPLVTPQGRITKVDTDNQFFVVDAVGSDLTTENDNLNSYVNIIDGQTGNRKGSFQIKNIQNNRIYIKTTPSRSLVYNLPISSDLAGLTEPRDVQTSITIEPDDLVCVVAGSCIPFFKKPFSNYLIQHAVSDIRRKLGEGNDMEERIKADLLQIVERSWVAREQSIRVTKKNNNWDGPVRRYWGNNQG
jgi:hypothetical protein